MASDRYRYFRREGRELHDALTNAVLALRSGEPPASVLPAARRHAHTLKGAAGVVHLDVIAELAHRIEECLGPSGDDGFEIDDSQVSVALGILEEIDRELDKLYGDRGPADTTNASTAVGATIDPAEMAALVSAIDDVGMQVESLSQALRAKRDGGDRAPTSARAAAEEAGLRGPSTTFAIQRLRRLTRGLREAASRIRLVPVGSLFAGLERSVIHTAESQDKKVTFTAEGGDVRLDAHVIAALKRALLHVVRNAVVHGIEPPHVRVAAGKPAAGRVVVTARSQGHQLVISCEDDGRGIDPVAIERAARSRSLLPEGEDGPLDAREAFRLIFEPGLSTAGVVTEVSGRGIGLDAVRDSIRQVHGTVGVHEGSSGGLVFEMTIPVSLTSARSLVLVHGSSRGAVPFDSVKNVTRVAPSDLTRLPGGSQALDGERPIAFASLGSLIDPRAAGAGETTCAVVLETGSGTVAIGASRILGASFDIVNRVPAAAGPVPMLTGLSFDIAGAMTLVLDPEEVGRRITSREHFPVESAEEETKPPLLIVDDSLTTRMLEQSILEAHGYEVDVAESVEDALPKLHAREYGLCVVDVEMPGLNGFELITAMQEDPALKDVPAILMTTLTSDEDRRRGMEVGAQAYLLKSEFEEGLLLETIERFIG